MRVKDINPVINKSELARKIGYDPSVFRNVAVPFEHREKIAELSEFIDKWIKKHDKKIK